MVILIPILALVGFTNAFFLHLQHLRFLKSGKKIFCLLGENCEAVVESKYGVTLGVKNELWGLGFYFLVLLLSLTQLNSFILPLSFLAAIFSVYLTYLQTFVLKKFCSWCLLAIAVNFAIFIASWGL